MKRKLFLLLFLIILGCLLPVMGFAYSSVSIVVNGEEIETDVASHIMEGRVMVPFRFIAEALGANVNWIAETKTVEVTTKEIQMPYIGITHLERDCKNRFVAEQANLLFLPHKDAPPQREIFANTLVEVNELVEVDGERWLNVTIPVYDTPMNMKGWIKEADTVLFTKELEKKVQGDVTIKAGTEIYEVWSFDDISSEVKRELNRDTRGRIEERKDGYVEIFAPGGQTFWVKEKHVVYPSAE